MLAACYNFVLEAIVTRFRAALFSGLAFGLGAVATGGLRLLDSRHALVGAVGSAAMLGVALVVETVKRPGDDEIRREVAELRRSFSAMRAHLTELEILLVAMKGNAEAALRRSYPDTGAAERTGQQRSL